MKLKRRSLRQYRKAVDEQADAAKRYVMKALSIYFEQNPNASTADGRNFAIALLKTSMPNFCDVAGTLAADFFDEICEAEGIDVTSQLYDTTDYEIVEDKVRYFARRLNDGDVDAFKHEVVEATHYFVKRSAYDNMIMNCEANEVRYARVPSGFETCSFCFMLASRGFVYRSEERAHGAHGYHDNCDCCIVPGKKGRTRIEGYDPQGMAERWGACERAIGGDAQAKADWDALPQEEKDDYIQRHKTIEAAFRHFKEKRILNEVGKRDWEWLYTGSASGMEVVRKLWNQPPENAGFGTSGKGAKRKAAHWHNWQRASLNDAIARFAANPIKIQATKSGKIIIYADNGRTQVVVDRFGGYFTIQLTGVSSSQRQNLDINGGIPDPDAILDDDEYQPLVHYSIGELRGDRMG